MRKVLLLLLLIPVLVQAAVTIKNDTFTEAGDTNVTSHTSDSGGGWRGASVSFQVLGATDNVWLNATSTASLIGDEGPSETDYVCTMECILNGAATTDRCALSVRADGGATHNYNDASSSYYHFRIWGDGATGVQWSMYRVDSGSIDQGPGDCASPCDGTVTGADSDDPVKARLKVEGTGATVTLTAEYDVDIDGGGYDGFASAVTVADTDAARITTAGDVGFYIRNNNVRMDDFFCEDLTSASAVVPIIVNQIRRKKQ